MTFKIKAIITAIATFLYLSAARAWSLVESPVRGQVNAAVLDDTTTSYAASQAINRHNIIEGLLLTGFIIFLFIIWCPTKRSYPKF
jgi:hypothetical protein